MRNLTGARMLALLLMTVVVACTAAEPISPTPDPSRSATASLAPSAAPSPMPTGPPAGGIEAYPLGALHGEHAFVLNGGGVEVAGAIAEMWAIPLAGGEPRLAVRYVNTTSRTATGGNLLARQLSPDGKRVVLSVVTSLAAGRQRLSLAVVDLETGRTTMVGSDDGDRERPAWSPDGNRIAYVSRPDTGTTTGGFDSGIWVMNVDGSGVRQVIPVGSGIEIRPSTHFFGWTPDGRIAWAYSFLQATLTLTDITSGAHTRIAAFIEDARGLSFRTAAPRIAGAFSDRPNCTPAKVLITDGAPERVLVRVPDEPNCPNVAFGNVRWSPARDEILYGKTVLGAKELYLHEVSGAPVRIAAQAMPLLAEWSSAGTHVLYINSTATGPVVYPLIGTELRYVRRDGSDERTVFAPRGLQSLSDVAVRLYP